MAKKARKIEYIIFLETLSGENQSCPSLKLVLKRHDLKKTVGKQTKCSPIMTGHPPCLVRVSYPPALSMFHQSTIAPFEGLT